MKRRRFTGTGGTGDEHQAVREIDEPFPLLDIFSGETEIIETRARHLRVEDSDDELLAVFGWNGRETHFDLSLIGEFVPDVAVLGLAPLVNLHIRQDFDARQDREHELGIEVVNNPHLAVDAETDLAAADLGFHVDVGRTLVKGELEKPVDDANDGRSVLAELVALDLAEHAVKLMGALEIFGAWILAREFLSGLADRAKFLDEVTNRSRTRDDEINFLAADVLDFFHPARGERFVGRDLDMIALNTDRHDLKPADVGGRKNLSDGLDVDLERIDVKERELRETSEPLHQRVERETDLGSPGVFHAELSDDREWVFGTPHILFQNRLGCLCFDEARSDESLKDEFECELTILRL